MHHRNFIINGIDADKLIALHATPRGRHVDPVFCQQRVSCSVFSPSLLAPRAYMIIIPFLIII